jgi:hypothetical protein
MAQIKILKFSKYLALQNFKIKYLNYLMRLENFEIQMQFKLLYLNL